MQTDLFDYHLPPQLIAQKPLERRRDSLLLAVNCEKRTFEHTLFRDLRLYLQEGDCLVLNSSRVRRARIHGFKEGGGAEIEILLLNKDDNGKWNALARPARRLRPGVRLKFAGGEMEAEVIETHERGEVSIRLSGRAGRSVEAIIEEIGEIPLPPYIKAEPDDPERYQTVFASQLGSAAAPTAGLHFEQEELRALEETGVKPAFLRLDIGLDTFRPIETELLEDHRIHMENYAIDESACNLINSTREEGGRIVAVGTTVVRALESCASGGEAKAFSGDTDLFIYPGFRFQLVDCLLTNFHMPKSSLLALVCAFAGTGLVMEAYQAAVMSGYRFLSLGDACFFNFPNGRDTFK
ncbi:MAG: tRNA preQ1(34) S-adenosylmethionine ribosyltransferase-isomerase QueA [Candidatus Solincola sediminis]|uniref:S-adenosylmethionine:tRNA ribosyltransferase-isomerase n=1 Tax=Candidatus Solincola sediminis TaxID=1797199 RepID=A0A1F2WFP3_9ACTN|nr:MAG: tRNA preQ1(34) S-adenosylmethionine ribosyltransferase-isomerase QueA [Candidatus Solincola sediminis]OFW58103.1 MAG: tRNA preQ1(34) S-adenosylmethionine ribosyltransferase-isomerase QueA [Candidatus Solincola sediminis]